MLEARRSASIFAVLAAKPAQVHARGEALGLGIGVGADRRDGEDRVRLGWKPSPL
jgi:hypothetical protein